MPASSNQAVPARLRRSRSSAPHPEPVASDLGRWPVGDRRQPHGATSSSRSTETSSSTAAPTWPTASSQSAPWLRRGVDGDRPERLGPAPLGPRRHRHVLELGRRQAGLDLGVHLVAAVGEPLLPASPAAAGAPDEQLAAAQLRRSRRGRFPARRRRRRRSTGAARRRCRRRSRRRAPWRAGNVTSPSPSSGIAGDAQAVRVLGAEGPGGRGEDPGVGA